MARDLSRVPVSLQQKQLPYAARPQHAGHRRPLPQLPQRPGMAAGEHRHPAAQCLLHRPAFLGAAPLVKHQHIRRQTAHRPHDSLGLAAARQHVTVRERLPERKLAALIRYRYPQPPPGLSGRQLPGRIPQQAGFPAGRCPAQHGAARHPVRTEIRQQRRGTALVRPRHPQTDRRQLPHGRCLSVFGHHRAAEPRPAAAVRADKALPQLLLVGVHRIAAQPQQAFVQLLLTAQRQPRLPGRRHLAAQRDPPFPIRRGQRQRPSAPQPQLVHPLLHRRLHPLCRPPQRLRQIGGRL